MVDAHFLQDMPNELTQVARQVTKVDNFVVRLHQTTLHVHTGINSLI